jgi:hypothetical protein
VKPKTKILTLLFALILPYMAVVMYFALRIQDHPLPTWFPYFGLSYILGTILLVTAFSKIIHRNVPPQSSEKARPAVRWMLRAWAGYLVVIWSGAFVWGLYETVMGRMAWQRAIPAGAFLLAFIAIFSRALYGDFKRKIQPETLPKPSVPSKS